jgi:hypothetical protein
MQRRKSQLCDEQLGLGHASIRLLQIIAGQSIDATVISPHSGNECPPNSRALFGMAVTSRELRVIAPRVQAEI